MSQRSWWSNQFSSLFSIHIYWLALLLWNYIHKCASVGFGWIFQVVRVQGISDLSEDRGKLPVLCWWWVVAAQRSGWCRRLRLMNMAVMSFCTVWSASGCIKLIPTTSEISWFSLSLQTERGVNCSSWLEAFVCPYELLWLQISGLSVA